VEISLESFASDPALGQCGVSARLFPWLLVMFVSLFAVGPANAGVDVELPKDWAKQGALDQSAIQRAQGWASALGGSLTRTEGSGNVDNFVETLAIIEFAFTMDGSALESDAAAQGYLDSFMSPLVGDSEAQEIARVALPGEGGAVSVQGHYLVGGKRIQAVIIPEGTRTSLLLVASLESEYVLYAPILSSVLDSIGGGAAPVLPFEVKSFRSKYIAGWLLAFVLIYFASIALFSERKGDHKRVGARAAGICAALAVGGGIFLYLWLGDAGPSLAAVGSSAGDLATEFLGFGLVGATIVFGIAQFLESDEGVIMSAPASVSLSSKLSGVGAPPPSHLPPASHAPPPSHLPLPSHSPPQEDAPTALEEEKQTKPMSAAGNASKRVAPPPPSSTARRVQSSPLRSGAPAALEPARSEPAETVRLPSRPPAKD
jgi:hypothetical protein